MRLLRLALVVPVLVSTACFGLAATPAEQRAAQAMEAARKAGHLDLEAFLRGMPKGGELHMHLSGAVYAETFLKDAAADGECVNVATLSLAKNPGSCPAGEVTAASVFTNQKLYDQLVDAFSMRAFVPSAGTNGHDQFFATFDRFGTMATNHAGEWLDEVASRAAAQNEQYLEVMYTPNLGTALGLAGAVTWPKTPATTGPFAQDTTGTSREQLAAAFEALKPGLAQALAADRAEFDRISADRNRIEHCGQADAAPGCGVTIRFLFQVLRAFPPQVVYAQTVLGFAMAATDPEVVGLNYVQPEDAYMAMSEYTRQMGMLDYLHSVYPKVRISLHAGEVAPGLVAPDGLRFHIRQAVELGHAERIGHGVDVMHEDDPKSLLKELAAKHVMVEINLTSNDVILGVGPAEHPLPDYLAAHVPVALSTDDEGVSRIDLTHEYTRAALEYRLGYLELKRMARTSIEHSFLAGASLWAKPDEFSALNPACVGQAAGSEATGVCAAYLKANERAAAEWELERRYRVFEAKLP